jgi:hypothetical protein
LPSPARPDASSVPPGVHRASALDLAISIAALVVFAGGGAVLAGGMATGRLAFHLSTLAAALAGLAIGLAFLLVSLGERVVVDGEAIERRRLWTLLWRKPLREVELRAQGAPGSLRAAVLVVNRRSGWEIDRLQRRNYAGRLKVLAEEE